MKTIELGQYTIDIPANGISPTGVQLIQDYLVSEGFWRIPDTIPANIGSPGEGDRIDWSWDWKVLGKGEYVGTLPKRIAKLLWQARKVKLSAAQLSRIGTIGSAHSGRHETYYFDIVDHFNWGQDDFGQPDSCCYWSCHASAKEMIHENGGLAIRFFRSADGLKMRDISDGFARAWLAPYDACWIVFNGYGLETLSVARILAAHLDHAYYHKLFLRNNRGSQGYLWINNSSGYIVGNQQSVLHHGEVDLEWENILNKFLCSACEDEIDEDDHYHNPGGDNLCEECFNDSYTYCRTCDEIVPQDDCDTDPDGDTICESCYGRLCVKCEGCDETIWQREAIEGADDKYRCGECHSEIYVSCEGCDADVLSEDRKENADGECYCEDCYSEIYTNCTDCDADVRVEDCIEISCSYSGSHATEYYCEDCREALETCAT